MMMISLLVFMVSAACSLHAAEQDNKTNAVTLEQGLKLGSLARMQKWQLTRQYMLDRTNLVEALIDLIGHYVVSQQSRWIPHKPSSSDQRQPAYGDFAICTIHKGLPVCGRFKLYATGRTWDKRLIRLPDSPLVSCIVEHCGKPQQQLLCDLNQRPSATLANLGVDAHALEMFQEYMNIPWTLVPKDETYSAQERCSRHLLDAGCSMGKLGSSLQKLYERAVNIRKTPAQYAKLNQIDQALVVKFIKAYEYETTGAKFVAACKQDSAEQGLLFGSIVDARKALQRNDVSMME